MEGLGATVANDDQNGVARTEQERSRAERAASDTGPSMPGQRPASQQGAAEANRPPPADPQAPGQERVYLPRESSGPEPPESKTPAAPGADDSAGRKAGPDSPGASGAPNPYGPPDDPRPPPPYGTVRYDPRRRY